ncbi:MAG: hypothetical protein GY869_04070, partial [Planctomycetes bacterium]|nr:hypothetical protein [Planctomycetota bacterium]
QDFQDILQSVAYQNTNNNNPNTNPRIITYEIDDGEFSRSVTATVNVIGVNDPPEINVGAEITYLEGDSPIILDNSLTVTDPDEENITSASVVISAGFISGEDSLAAVDTLGITSSFSEASGVLTLNGSAPDSAYQIVLRTVTYQNTNFSNPNLADRIVSFTVNDGLSQDTDTATIHLTSANDGPYVADSIEDIPVNEDDDGEIVNLSGVFRDPDDPNAIFTYEAFNSNPDLITYSFENDSTLISLAFTPNGYGSAAFRIRATSLAGTRDDSTTTVADTFLVIVNPINDTPVITHTDNQSIPEDSTTTVTLVFSDVDINDMHTIAITSSDMENVSITDLSANSTYDLIPDLNWNGQTTIFITVTDSSGASASDNYNFTVTPVNDAPLVSDIPDTTIAEGSQFDPINLNDYVNDVEDNDAAISWNVSGNNDLDVIINNQEAQIIPPDLNWTGSDTILFTATDIGGLSATDQAIFTIGSEDDPPTVTTAIMDVQATEDAPAYAINLGSHFTDVDNDDNLITYLVNYNSNPNIVETDIDSTAQVLLLIFLPDQNGEAFIGIQANSAGQTTADTFRVVIQAVNDAPEISGGGMLVFSEGDEAVVISNEIQVVDIDGPELTATVTISSGFIPAEDVLSVYESELAWTFSNSVLSFTGTASAQDFQDILQSVAYQNTNVDNPNTNPRVITYEIDDSEFSRSVTATVNVIGVNDPPEINLDGEITYLEGDPPIMIDNSLTVTDPDEENITSASVVISAGFISGEDFLAAVDTLGITSSFSEASGVLTLSGSAPDSVYQDVLRIVTYQNTNFGNPNLTDRIVVFMVNDGLSQATDTTTVHLTNVNDGPYVAQAISDIIVNEDDDGEIVNLIGVFRDPDDPNADFTYEAFNSNPDLITYSFENDST